MKQVELNRIGERSTSEKINVLKQRFAAKKKTP
jgi:hypothetical protein